MHVQVFSNEVYYCIKALGKTKSEMLARCSLLFSTYFSYCVQVYYEVSGNYRTYLIHVKGFQVFKVESQFQARQRSSDEYSVSRNIGNDQSIVDSPISILRCENGVGVDQIKKLIKCQIVFIRY